MELTADSVEYRAGENEQGHPSGPGGTGQPNGLGEPPAQELIAARGQGTYRGEGRI